MGRSATLNEPSFFDSAVTSRFVATLRILTAAFCTTAPLESVTVPVTEPRVCWPVASCDKKLSDSSAITATVKRFAKPMPMDTQVRIMNGLRTELALIAQQKVNAQ